MKLSVIIPTIGRQEALFNTISDLSVQEFEHSQWECLIISQSRIDCEKFEKIALGEKINLRIYHIGIPNASLARNIGLIEAKGEIVLFLDDDLVIKSENFLLNHIENYKDSNIPAVSGQVTDLTGIVRNDRHRWSYKKKVGWLFFPSNYNERCKMANGTSCNLSVKKKLAIAIGGMDINYEKGAHREESDFCLRLTHKYGDLVFDPEASVIHLGVESGGNRSWGSSKGIHKFHHIMGEWYFILNGLKSGSVKIKDIHYYLLVLAARQIFNSKNIKNPFAVFYAIIKSLMGAIFAISKVIKKSKTLNNYSIKGYELIFENKI